MVVAICSLIFLFWGAYNKETFNLKWKIFRDQKWKVILIVALFIAGIVFRLTYPQAFEGTWFSDYVEHKRAVYFLGPWLWLVLFSIKNGWLIYTPVVLFSLPGFNILANRNKKIFYSTFLFCIVFLFLLSSSTDVSPKLRALQEFDHMDMSSYLSNESEFNISTLASTGFENSNGDFGGHIQNSNSPLFYKGIPFDEFANKRDHHTEVRGTVEIPDWVDQNSEIDCFIWNPKGREFYIDDMAIKFE